MPQRISSPHHMAVHDRMETAFTIAGIRTMYIACLWSLKLKSKAIRGATSPLRSFRGNDGSEQQLDGKPG